MRRLAASSRWPADEVGLVGEAGPSLRETPASPRPREGWRAARVCKDSHRRDTVPFGRRWVGGTSFHVCFVATDEQTPGRCTPRVRRAQHTGCTPATAAVQATAACLKGRRCTTMTLGSASSAVDRRAPARVSEVRSPRHHKAVASRSDPSARWRGDYAPCSCE